MGSTSDKISGKANEIAGKTKQAVGKATDDREMQAKGAVQEAKGKGQVATGKVKDKLKGRRRPALSDSVSSHTQRRCDPELRNAQ